MCSIKDINDFIGKWHRYFKAISFVIGFTIDWFFLPNITSKYYPYIAPTYIIIIFVFMLIRQVFLHQQHKRGLEDDNENSFYKMNKVWTFFISFFLGSLLSYLLVYYFRSAELLFSFHIFIILILCVFVNEIVGGVFFDILLFFISITFYCIYNTPLLVGVVNEKSFILSLFLSFLLMIAFTKILKVFRFKSYQAFLLYIFSIIFPILVYILYSVGSIPAVPLTLKDSGFYSFVAKNSPEYIIQNTGKVDYKKYYFIDKYYYDKSKIKSLYYYAAIVSPTDVNANINHIWEKYNNQTDDWDYISGRDNSFAIYGGREGGYRTFSIQNNINTGLWRVRVFVDDRLVGSDEIEVR